MFFEKQLIDAYFLIDFAVHLVAARNPRNPNFRKRAILRLSSQRQVKGWCHLVNRNSTRNITILQQDGFNIMSGLNFKQWQQRASELALPNQAFINGKHCPAISGETFTRINPATGQYLVDIASCDIDDVNIAVAAARASFESGIWSSKTPQERKATSIFINFRRGL